jgi:hypothetical protein
VGALGNGKPPYDPPGPASREIIPRDPVEAEGGFSGGENMSHPACPEVSGPGPLALGTGTLSTLSGACPTGPGRDGWTRKSVHPVSRGEEGEKAMNLEKHKLVINNAFSLTMLQHFDYVKVVVQRLSRDEVKRKIDEIVKRPDYEVVLAIGHESTARLVSQLLGFEVPMNRIQVSLDYRTELLVFQLRTRLPEGRILSEEELKQVAFDFYFVSLEPLHPPQRG